MLHNYFFKNRDDLIYFKKDSFLRGENEKSCIFTIDFSKVISYNMKNTKWFWYPFTPAIAIDIMFEGGAEYILMKKDISLKQVVFDNKDWFKKYIENDQEYNSHILISIISKITNE
tara:strand:+ start:6497 stop:6844 length:348 start_codon:yes stop_codon:yes gene_type:complete